jgi:hypothetical protein
MSAAVTAINRKIFETYLATISGILGFTDIRIIVGEEYPGRQ